MMKVRFGSDNSSINFNLIYNDDLVNIRGNERECWLLRTR